MRRAALYSRLPTHDAINQLQVSAAPSRNYIERIFMYRLISGRTATPAKTTIAAIAPRTMYSTRIDPPCLLRTVHLPSISTPRLVKHAISTQYHTATSVFFQSSTNLSSASQSMYNMPRPHRRLIVRIVYPRAEPKKAATGELAIRYNPATRQASLAGAPLFAEVPPAHECSNRN